MQVKRNNSLDTLRGIAILLMVLSASIAFGVMPGWMYHAQVPPPDHQFNPAIAGITWVDLVFPFFLFSMGAAIPLSMQNKLTRLSSWQILLSIAKRFILLVFFALFTMHARAWVLSDSPGTKEYVLSILSFGLLFLIYVDLEQKIGKRNDWIVKIISYLACAAIVFWGKDQDKSFNIHNPDIIILVLANMALFGTLIWWLTAKNIWIRMGVLPLIMAVFLASKNEGSINYYIYNWTPADWLYKFYYLKYLFIILPATLVGEWIITEQKSLSDWKTCKSSYLMVGMIGFLLLLGNVILLYSRELVLNFFLSVVLMFTAVYLIRKIGTVNIISRLVYTGSYLLLLGLLLESYEGGIKKDFSTYSYYFVCSGLAFFTMSSLYVLEVYGLFSRITRILASVGKNPMVAYTAGNLLLIPVLRLSGLEEYLNRLNHGLGDGTLRGVIFTGIVALFTIWTTEKKWFWKS
ncbi:DUF5009 domain-containing protein [Sphingobacterium spiritivorum]|uniref:DUF5009 domain-containing protein n=1 Tax=Sphingobacterium spiritivorum TaxID=258 RepID=UPI003DA1E84B